MSKYKEIQFKKNLPNDPHNQNQNCNRVLRYRQDQTLCRYNIVSVTLKWGPLLKYSWRLLIFILKPSQFLVLYDKLYIEYQ